MTNDQFDMFLSKSPLIQIFFKLPSRKMSLVNVSLVRRSHYFSKEKKIDKEILLVITSTFSRIFCPRFYLGKMKKDQDYMDRENAHMDFTKCHMVAFHLILDKKIYLKQSIKCCHLNTCTTVCEFSYTSIIA